MTPPPLTVYGIGNGIVDDQRKVTDVQLDELGLRKGGMQLVDPAAQAAIRDTLPAGGGEFHAGGSAANTVVAMAQLGARAAYACSLGDDADGRFYRDSLADYGVELTAGFRDGATGTSLILITPDGERTMNTCLGASTELAPGDIDGDAVAAAQWLYLEGYLLSNDATREAAFHAMDLAKAAGTPVAFSFSDGFIVDAFGDHLQRVVEGYADLVFANQHEAAAYTGLREPDQALDRILKDCDHAVVTHGAEGAYLHLNGETRHVAAFPATPVDLTGAGDLYAAGILYGLCTGRNALEAGLLGAKVAHRVVVQMGARIAGSLAGEVDAVARLVAEKAP